ncbi:hypothetical protein HYT00_00150 [Candidatus Giovannonibacteria bacterium]|nr:hypothetical protein [Candidatus Giovannonibacteria bacterium]
MGIIIAIILALSVGASAGAQNSLPGDFLYPVKINVNEKVEGLVAIGDEADARLAIDLAIRRLEEAETLATNGKLNADTRVKVESGFENETEKAEKKIERLKAKNDINAASEVSSEFESSLSAHKKILLEIKNSSNKAEVEVESLLGKIEIKVKSASDGRIELESKIETFSGADTKSAAEGKLKSAENKITEVKKFIEGEKVSLGAEALAAADSRIKVAENTVVEGRAKLEAQKYGEAFIDFQRAHRIAREAKLLAEAKSDLNIEVKINGDFDDEDDDAVKNEIRSKIETDTGELDIRVENGNIRLSGKLNRANPCIEWSVGKTLSAGTLTFDITKKSTADICVQVLGKPQEINITDKVEKNTNVIVKLEGKIVFSGKVN